MKVGRNDPCPCGSGKKYKRCCLARDRAATEGGQRRSLTDEAPGLVAAATEWQADVLPMGGSFGEDPTSRAAIALVTAAGFVVHFDSLDHPSAEPEGMAEDLEAVLEAAAGRTGGWPRGIRVRWPEVAEVLSRRLTARGEPAGLKVAAGHLAEVDEAGGALLASMGANPSATGSGVYASSPDSWAAWDLPAELVARIFRAAAAFHRAAPWTVHANVDVLEATTRGDRTWTACIMGQGGKEYGLALYSHADDFWQVSSPVHAPGEGFQGLQGPVVSLLLDPGHTVSKALRREVAKAGWELAGPQAYPHVITLNTPAGGLRLGHAEDLAAILEAVPRFVAEHSSAVEAARPVEDWRDRETGVRLSYYAEVRVLEQLTDELSEDFFAHVGPLEPGGPEGPGADPEAAFRLLDEREAEELADAELEVAERFADSLKKDRGLSSPTIEKHALNAVLFVDFLVWFQRIPLCAVHEYDLRFFLYDVLHRVTETTETQASAMPASLKRFFEFLAAEEGIVCPWARAILSDRETYEERRRGWPGGLPEDEDVEEWRIEHDEELHARLLLPDSDLGEDDEWGEGLGPTEERLLHEIHRRWLVWRDEEIRSGTSEPREVVVALLARQRAWETGPHPALKGKTPVQAIHAERRAQEREARKKRRGWGRRT